MENLEVIYLGERKVRRNFVTEVLAKFYALIPKVAKKETVSHHILLVDVSGSMSRNIPTLKKKLEETLEALKADNHINYVSVILYSSHGQCYRIVNAVKCDDMSYKMAKVMENIEKELYCRSLTVISEPMEKAIEISESLVGVTDNNHIILFTDGCVVPSQWGFKEEEEKCFALAKICKEKNYFLNAIGFGGYYDREFLKKLVGIVDGTVNHIDEIPQYYDTVLELVGKINNETIIEVPINNNDYFIVSDSIQCNEPKVIKSLKKDQENIVVVFEEDLNVDGQVFTSKPKEVNNNIVNEFLYSLTLDHILQDDVDSAEVSIAQTGDVRLFNLLSNGYSFVEKGRVINNLQTVLVDPSQRYLDGEKEIKVLSAEEEPICLLEVLQSILNDDNSTLYWDMKSNYKRISQKVNYIEDDIAFEMSKDRYMPITSVTIAGNKLNINVKAVVNGQVVNKKTTMKMDAIIYKDYTLIKNGIINVDRIAAKVSPELKDLFKDFTLETLNYNGEELIVLDLMKIKATNKRMLRSTSPNILAKNLSDVQLLGVKQWAIKQIIKRLTVSNNVERIDLTSLSEEVIEARKAFRIDEKGVYIPLSSEKDESQLFELYRATFLEWKIEKFPEKALKEIELKRYESLVVEDDLKQSFANLNAELTKVQEEKRRKENQINLVRISCGLIGKPVFLWENVTSKAKKSMDKAFNMNMVINGTVEISTKKIDDIIIRQDKYDQFVKAN